MEAVAIQWASGSDRERNRRQMRYLIEAATGSADLVVLPEASHRAFGDRPAPLAESPETLEGPFVTSLVELSAGGATIVAGMFEDSGDARRPFNTTVVVADGAVAGSYRKIHLYDALGFIESEGMSPGPAAIDDLVVVDVAGAKVGVQTCFDLRFPEISAALAARGAEILVLGAAWVPGQRKVEQWRTLLAARAIETTSFVVAAAQPAPRYCGHSSIVSPSGEILAEAGDDAGSISATLDLSSLSAIRSSMPVLQSRRLDSR